MPPIRRQGPGDRPPDTPSLHTPYTPQRNISKRLRQETPEKPPPLPTLMPSRDQSPPPLSSPPPNGTAIGSDTTSNASGTNSSYAPQESSTSRSSSPEHQIQGQLAQAVHAATEAAVQSMVAKHKKILELASMLDRQIEAFQEVNGSLIAATFSATVQAFIKDYLWKKYNTKKGLTAENMPQTYTTAA